MRSDDELAILSSCHIVEQRTPWNALLGSECGLIKELWEIKIDPCELPLFVFAARCGPRVDILGCRRKSLAGSGAAMKRDTALVSAVGETVERYCASYISDAPILTAEALGCQALNLDQLSLFSDRQYSQPKCPYVRPTKSQELRWEWMTSWTDKKPVAVPIELIYLGHPPAGTKYIAPTISTGLACADNDADAILRGAYEAIERDAFNIVWLNRLSMPQIDVKGVCRELDELVENSKRLDIELRFILLKLDIDIPVVMCVAISHRNAGAALSVGAAARLDPVEAAIKAGVEAVHTRHWLLQKRRVKKVGRVADVHDFDDHVLYYDEDCRASSAAFVTSSTTTVSLSDCGTRCARESSDALHVLNEKIERCGLTLLYRDVTTEDVRETGLCVFKSVIPGLQNINSEHSHRFLGGTRLYELPVELGLLKRPYTEDELNTDPHPFP